MRKVEELQKGFLFILLEVKIWQMVSCWTYSQQEIHLTWHLRPRVGLAGENEKESKADEEGNEIEGRLLLFEKL